MNEMTSPAEGERGEGEVTIAPTDQAAKQLADHAAEIRKIGKRVVEDVVEIGRRLTDCKRIAGHGNWLPWLEREFGWGEITALNFMRVYEMSKSSKFENLNIPVSGLYLLAAPSTPEAAREEVIERAQAGEKLRHARVREIVGEHKPAPPKKNRKRPEETQDDAQPDLPLVPSKA
jgi:hypothetical protein